MPKSVAELVELLDIEDIDGNLFRGRQPDTELQRVFGGQVAAQALIAAARTVPADYHVHSLHSYFLRPGDTAVPIVYDVEDLRQGRSFATRRVVARQHGRPIYLMSANFQIPEGGFEHQDVMPDVAPPEEGIGLAEMFGARQDGRAEHWAREWAALDVRYLGNSATGGVSEDPARPARSQLWIRVADRLSDDPLEHLATFTYASDMTLLGAALVPHGVVISAPGMQAASLDHTIWFHRPFRADEWWLFDQHAPRATGGRGLSLASVYSESGELVATVAQEGLIRHRDPEATTSS
ncbi:acyl-CoA thioesterase [Nocardioides donggukensis]|uniref:Acyl-CoA thioesterase 2 n=1 Tax=Nocardioides donggukensis TaxID=2774019 RepID=A0A927K4J0_9ACTN|nr:acyl-CoA thioesterase II [Nocardioides donggukensis]MBD8869598.1 acyl-CoA thioesterase II [Nocardioides donggukensis]